MAVPLVLLHSPPWKPLPGFLCRVSSLPKVGWAVLSLSPVQAAHLSSVQAAHPSPVRAAHPAPVRAAHPSPMRAAHPSPVRAAHPAPVRRLTCPPPSRQREAAPPPGRAFAGFWGARPAPSLPERRRCALHGARLCCTGLCLWFRDADSRRRPGRKVMWKVCWLWVQSSICLFSMG